LEARQITKLDVHERALTRQKRAEYQHKWYVQNRDHVLARVSAYQRAHPETWKSERSKACRKAWWRTNREKMRAWKREWRSRNPLLVRGSDHRYRERQREKLYPRISTDILSICRDDPRRAVGIASIAGLDRAVCLECGEVHPSLPAHIARRHMPTLKYRKKWGYAKNTALVSANWSRSVGVLARQRARHNCPKPPSVVVVDAVSARLEWGVAKETRLKLRDAFLGKKRNLSQTRRLSKRGRPKGADEWTRIRINLAALFDSRGWSKYKMGPFLFQEQAIKAIAHKNVFVFFKRHRIAIEEQKVLLDKQGRAILSAALGAPKEHLGPTARNSA
jgi:hypothetical protein